MDKLDLQTKDLVQENISKLEALFPNCVTEFKGAEGKIVKKVDLNMLAREVQYEPLPKGRRGIPSIGPTSTGLYVK